MSEAQLSQQWNVIGFSAMSCVFSVACFSLWLSRQSGRRLFICLEFLSLTSSTFVRMFLCGNSHIWDSVSALVLRSGGLFYIFVSILYFSHLPGLHCAPLETKHGIQAEAVCFVYRELWRGGIVSLVKGIDAHSIVVVFNSLANLMPLVLRFWVDDVF